MGKMTNLILLMIAIQATLFLFAGSDPVSTAIWQVATNPFDWTGLSFFGTFIIIASGVGVTGLVIGGVIGIKTDFMLFAALVAGLITLGAPIISLAATLQAHASSMFCPGIDPAVLVCPLATIFTALTTGSLAIYYVMTVIAWWRGAADSS